MKKVSETCKKRPFAQNLIAIRVREGITNDQLAEAIGVKVARLRSWMEDRVQPSYDLLATICEKYGIEDAIALIKDPAYVSSGGKRTEGITIRTLQVQMEELNRNFLQLSVQNGG